MNILLAGALSWNPERVMALSQRGHKLFGLWSRTMAWEQGPYPFARGVITDLDVEGALDLLRGGGIDVVYSLFQVYDQRLWAPAAAVGVEDHWTQLRRLLAERRRGAFRVPVVRHWGFDIHSIDLDVARALDGQIFCNRQKLRYWTARREEGGCGLDLGLDEQEVAFMDSDLPWREFMNNRFTAKLSQCSGEIHTVCIGRPLGINFVEAARHGIHVHVYGNNYDDVATMIARGLSPGSFARLKILLDTYVHIHPSIQANVQTLAGIRAVKDRWVEEFSRYDAGWSYVGRPLPWPRREDEAAIPNRLGTYLLAGLPVITEKLPGFDRYDVLADRGVAVDFSPRDYAALAADLRNSDKLNEMTEKARACREQFSFDATVDPLLGYLERVCNRHRLRAARPFPMNSGSRGPVQLYARPLSLRGLLAPRAKPGSWKDRAVLHGELAVSRARWAYARVLAKLYLSRLLRPRERR
ncbi:MAG: hypothetical protein JNN08_06290 [Bryobacterales bacterium]|nr:hypothetical protein [Bryobacterales bacterium]